MGSRRATAVSATTSAAKATRRTKGENGCISDVAACCLSGRRRDVLDRGGRGGGAFGETLDAVQPIDVDRDDAFGTAREDAGELHVPAELVPEVRGAGDDARRKGLLVRVHEDDELGLGFTEAVGGHAAEGTVGGDGMHDGPVEG